MDSDDFLKIVSTASAIGATVGGAISFLVTWGWKLWERADSIQVVHGPSGYDPVPGHAMYVINKRGHRTEIRDYGFVLSNGELLSAPIVWEEGAGEERQFDATSGNGVLAVFNERFEINMESGLDIVGAYARTIGQRRPTISFRSWDRIPFHRRLRIRWKNWFVRTYH